MQSKYFEITPLKEPLDGANSETAAALMAVLVATGTPTTHIDVFIHFKKSCE